MLLLEEVRFLAFRDGKRGSEGFDNLFDWKLSAYQVVLINSTDNAPVILIPCCPHPTPAQPGHGRGIQCECESQWSSQTLGQKYWVTSPPLGTQLYKPKSSVCRLGCDSLS